MKGITRTSSGRPPITGGTATIPRRWCLPGRWPKGFLADLQPQHLHQPDGSVRGHNHVLMHAVRGVAELAAETKDVRYLEWAKAAYKYYNDNGFDTGWLPEIRDLPDHNNHSEMCLVGDMTEIELWFARAGWPSYWDRVDRTIRNIVVPGQYVLTPAIERMWREVNQGKSPAEAERSIQLLKDLQGGFLSGLTPNDRIFEVNPKGSHAGTVEYRGRKIVLDMMGCCPPEGMRALYLAWRDTVQETPQGVMVNLAFDRDAPRAKVVSQMPRKGQMTVTAKSEGDSSCEFQAGHRGPPCTPIAAGSRLKFNGAVRLLPT